MKIKDAFRQIIISVLILLVLPLSGYSLVINKIKVLQYPHNTHVSLYTDYRPNVNVLTLKQPERIVVDVADAHFRYKVNPRMFALSPVKSVRVGRHDGKLRLVFDLKFRTPYHHSLVHLHGGGYAIVLSFPKSWAATLPKANPDYHRSKNIVVVIDPGHGGIDPGTTGPNGTHEKNVVLSIAKDMYADLKKAPGFTPKLTRTGDYYVGLRQRLTIARQDHADMFIAVHADAFKDKSAQGASVFALSLHGATSEAARWLARRENASELMAGVDLSDKSQALSSVLLDLSQTATIHTSLNIGYQILKHLSKVAHLHHGDHVEQAAFVVLKSPDIPSLLVETGFLSNPKEEHRLNQPKYRANIAKALSQGIVGYFRAHPPRGTMLYGRLKHPKHSKN